MLGTLQWQIKRAGNRPKVHYMRGPIRSGARNTLKSPQDMNLG
jgi:hypothetical protein